MSVNIHGKEYRTVAERVNAIHKDFPGRVEIDTQIIEHYRPEGPALRDSAGRKAEPAEVTIKATITTVHDAPKEWDAPYRLMRISYTGHAHEVQDLSVPQKGKKPKVNATSYLENSETSAIGRALAAAGYAGSEFASANEMNTALRCELKMEINDLKARLEKGIQMYQEVVKALKGYQQEFRTKVVGKPQEDNVPDNIDPDMPNIPAHVGDPYTHFNGNPQPGEE